MRVLEEAAGAPSSGIVDPEKMTGPEKVGTEIRKLRV